MLEQEPPAPSTINPRIPHELERICLGCLEKNPADRYRSAEALAADLARFLRGEPAEIPSATPRQKLRRWCRRQPALASHLAGLVLVMLIVQAKYMISGYDLPFHVRIMGVMGLWCAAAIGFQWLLNRPASAVAARYAWAVADVALSDRGAGDGRRAVGAAGDQLSAGAGGRGVVVQRAAGGGDHAGRVGLLRRAVGAAARGIWPAALSDDLCRDPGE